jgi:cytochrome P450
MTLQSFATVPKPAHVPADRVVDFDAFNPPEVARDFQAAWKRLQDSAGHDVVWTPRSEGHWIALRGKPITDVFQHPEIFSSRIFLMPRSIGEHHKMLPTSLDPPLHGKFRAIINPAFAPKRIQALEEQISRIAIDLIQEVRLKGGCNFTTAFAEQFPVRVFLAMVNLPVADAPRLKYLSDQLIRPDGAMTYAQVMQAFADYMAPYIEERRARPGQDFLSDMVNATIDGRPLSYDERMNLTTQVMIAGLDTVVNFLGFLMHHLARNPDDRRLLAADPRLLPEAVDEFMRRFGLVSICRLVTQDVEFYGVPLKKDELILLPTMLHGLDERVNPNPMTVDFNRSGHRHSGFGQGPHHCVGRHLARAELQITIREWLARIPDFEIAPGQEPEYIGGLVGCVRALHLRWNPARTRP